MNISYNWLKQYINFTLTPDELAAALTSIGLEVGTVEEVESIRGGLKGLVVGHVLTCIEHPDSDHLHITTVDLGDGQPTQIVCGAPNVAAGQKVIVATVGTTLYDGDKEFKIKKSKIRGTESFGMICAEDEIGVGASHDGIMVLPEDTKPGTPAAEYFGLTSDWLIEVDLTPNRIDAASHFGVARDLHAWLKQHATPSPLQLPQVETFAADRTDGAVSVVVENPELCPRYSGLTIRGVKVTESPKWLRDRLTAIGQRPINAVVDVTNYILNGIGQPLHCFDLAKVDGEKIVVKTCAKGTPFTTLDGVEHHLDERDLMICSASKPMCIAGVFGGLDSGVTMESTDIFLESAYFQPTTVRRSARRHGLSTDASFRYERGTDPNITLYALKLAALMIKEICGGEICGNPVDVKAKEFDPFKVELTYGYINSLIGKEIPKHTVHSILESLQIAITPESDDTTMHLLVPTYRVDVQRPCDVVEDLLRIYGYNNVEISTTVHSSLSYKSPTDINCELRTLISEQLTACGFNEILNNSLTAEAYYIDSTTYPIDTCVRLLNPLSNELCLMRRTLLYGGLESIAHNINRKLPDLLMYEFGNVYKLNPQAESTAEAPLAPYSEEARLGIWLTGSLRPASWLRPADEAGIYDLKAVVANIFTRLGINPAELKYTVEAPDEIFAASLAIASRSGKELGRLGILSKGVLKMCGIKQPVCYASLRWDDLVKMAIKHKVTYTPLPKTHPVKRDLALLIDNNVTMAQIEATVRESERKLLKNVALFDAYQGDKLPEGKKSYAISITLQDDEKTLQDKQIEAVMAKITTNLTKKLGAQLR